MKKIFLGFILVFATLFTSVLAEDTPRAVIIFDASGSMWGQINGKAKIEIARDALKNVVKEWNPNVELGLTVYGHRSKGDCNDIESVIPVGKVDKDRVIRTVMGIKPKGKTPISRSLRKVADEIKYTEEKATIILISDGKETCDPDPCGTAKELEKEGIDFVTHVIGFNVDKKTDKQLECIANVTGGEYFSAKNAAALNKAMKVIAKKVEVVVPPKPKVKKLDHTLEVSASEKEGGKWIKANHQVYEDEDGKKGDRIISANSRKKYPGEAQIPVGKYILLSNYNSFKKETPFEVKPGEVTKIHVVMGETGMVETSASEKKDGKWIKANHQIYEDEDGKKGDRIISANSRKKYPGEAQIPVGKYILLSNYNSFKKETPFEVKPGEVTKIHVVMGETGIVETSASEKEDGKWVKASHYIFEDDEGKAGSSVTSVNSGKKEVGEAQIPAGKYILRSRYNDFEKFTPFEVKAGETTKIHVVMGETGMVETSASEKKDGKWVKVSHYIFEDDEGKTGSSVTSVNSGKKEAGEAQIPAGKYILRSRYNDFEKFTPFEVKAGETTKIHVVMGETGSVEISTSEVDNGKWVKASGSLYKEDGDRLDGFRTGKDKPASYQLPAGKYYVKMSYNSIEKQVPFEVKPGEVNKLHVVMGQTGVVESSASEKEGGKWIHAGGYVYPLDDNGEKGKWITQIITSKNRLDSDRLPVGKYIAELKYNNAQKDEVFEITAGKILKLHVIFGQFMISAKCSDMHAKVNYEVYAGNGRLIEEKQLKCSDTLKLTLDDGDYRVEAKVGEGIGEAKFTVGSGKPNKLILDLSNLNNEEEIKADSQEAVVVPVTPKKKEVKAESKVKTEKISIGGKEIEIKGMSKDEAKQLKDLGAMLGALGGMMQGANAGVDKEKQNESDAKADKEFDEMSKDLDMFTK